MGEDAENTVTFPSGYTVEVRDTETLTTFDYGLYAGTVPVPSWTYGFVLFDDTGLPLDDSETVRLIGSAYSHQCNGERVEVGGNEADGSVSLLIACLAYLNGVDPGDAAMWTLFQTSLAVPLTESQTEWVTVRFPALYQNLLDGLPDDWALRGFTDAEVDWWTASGFGARDATEWSSKWYSFDPETAREFVHASLTSDEATEWMLAVEDTEFDLTDVFGFIAKGMKPTDVAQISFDDLYPDDDEPSDSDR